MSANQKRIDFLRARRDWWAGMGEDQIVNEVAVDVKTHVENLNLAADLLELHDRTGISLDNWESARRFVERYCGPIEENGV